MDISEALRRCCVMGKATVNENREPEVDVKLWLCLDPTTEEGAALIDWWNDTGPFTPIEVSSTQARAFTVEEALRMLAPKTVE